MPERPTDLRMTPDGSNASCISLKWKEPANSTGKNILYQVSLFIPEADIYCSIVEIMRQTTIKISQNDLHIIFDNFFLLFSPLQYKCNVTHTMWENTTSKPVPVTTQKVCGLPVGRYVGCEMRACTSAGPGPASDKVTSRTKCIGK